MAFNGLGMHLGTLSRLSSAQSRSISAENFTGEEKAKAAWPPKAPAPPCARDLGPGWKISPSIKIAPGEAPRSGRHQPARGAIQQIWMTPTGHWRFAILRIYWDNSPVPSVECPVGDFFACGWNRYAPISSLAVCVNPGSAFNCYWEMPFRNSCKVTLTNIADQEMTLYYQINYTLTDVPEDCGYFHAQFRRTNPLPHKQVYTILDGVKGPRPLRRDLPGLGGEQHRLVGRRRDQVLHGRRRRLPHHLRHRHRRLLLRVLQLRRTSSPTSTRNVTTPYAGLPQVIRPDGLYNSQQRFGLYRWHIMDPIRFQTELRVTIPGARLAPGRPVPAASG